jgi:protein-S-isoprenylcysteine O-methyltransferase Ste14
MKLIYSKILVALQFIIITLLLILNNSIFSNIFSLIILFSGFLFGLYTLKSNPLNNFNITPDIKKDAILITKGSYKLIRHPMYLSVLLIMMGVVWSNYTFMNFILYFSLIFVLYLKGRKEEKLWGKKLPQYNKYKENTKMIIPFIL